MPHLVRLTRRLLTTHIPPTHPTSSSPLPPLSYLILRSLSTHSTLHTPKPSSPLKNPQICRPLSPPPAPHYSPTFISAVSGLPKDFSNARFRRGQFGDDAWFVARNEFVDVLGVFDGVGGWRSYGLDPGDFSYTLMQACENIVASGVRSYPVVLLDDGFKALKKKKTVKGSTTACLLSLSRSDSVLHAANLGDSGFVVLRDGEIVHRSREQTHAFNTPYQLGVPPVGESGLCDSPHSAEVSQLKVLEGDLIFLATDGVFDNLEEAILIEELGRVQGSKDQVRLQKTANTIVLMARTIAFDTKYMSPFARHARRNGVVHAVGGKPDDITVLLATVSIGV